MEQKNPFVGVTLLIASCIFVVFIFVLAWRKMRQNVLTKIKKVEKDKAAKYRIEAKHEARMRFDQSLKNKIPITVQSSLPLKYSKLAYRADSFDELAQDLQSSEKRVKQAYRTGKIHFSSPKHALRRDSVNEKQDKNSDESLSDCGKQQTMRHTNLISQLPSGRENTGENDHQQGEDYQTISLTGQDGNRFKTKIHFHVKNKNVLVDASPGLSQQHIFKMGETVGDFQTEEKHTTEKQHGKTFQESTWKLQQNELEFNQNSVQEIDEKSSSKYLRRRDSGSAERMRSIGQTIVQSQPKLECEYQDSNERKYSSAISPDRSNSRENSPLRKKKDSPLKREVVTAYPQQDGSIEVKLKFRRETNQWEARVVPESPSDDIWRHIDSPTK